MIASRGFPAVPAERARRRPAAVACVAGTRATIADRPIAKAGRGMRRVAAGLASLLIVAMTVIPVFAASRPAYAIDLACQVTGSYNNIGPDTPGGGVEGLLPRVMLWKKNPKYVIDGQATLSDVPPPASNYTLWELDGTNGLDWSTSGKDVNNNDSCSVWNTTLSQVAQIIFEVPRFVVSVTNSLQEMVSTSQPVTPLLDRLDGGHTKNQGVVAQVFRWVTLPGAAIALVATGVWIMVRAGRRRRDGAQSYDREIVDGILWAVLATGVVLFLLIGNTWRTYLDAGDRAVGEFNSAVDSALLPNIGATGPCSLPSGNSSTVYNRGQRVAICNFYKTFAFDPWARGQYGSIAGKAIVVPCIGNKNLTDADLRNTYKSYAGGRRADVRVFQVEAQSYNLNDWRRVQAGEDAARKYPPGTSGHYSPWADVQSHVQGKANCSGISGAKLTASDVKTENTLKASYGDWQGNNGFQRIGIALSDAVLCLLCALPPLLASMLAFMFQILAWLAIFALPIVGVAGIFPPFRKWLTSLLQILLASYFARFAFGVALTMTELAYGIVFSSPFPFGVQILILLVIVVAAIHLIRAVREAGLTTSWSRAMHGSAVGMAGQAGRQAGRVGGAVLAGMAGGAVVAVEERQERRSRRNTVDQPAKRQDEQLRPTKRREGDPTVAPRRRPGVVIAADGATSEVAEPAAKERPAGGPQVARRLRRIEPEDAEPTPNGRAPVRTGGGADHSASNPPPGGQSSGGASPARSGSRVIDQTGRVVEHTDVRRRQDVVRATETPAAAESETPSPRSRRQEDRTRFVDPEL